MGIDLGNLTKVAYARDTAPPTTWNGSVIDDCCFIVAFEGNQPQASTVRPTLLHIAEDKDNLTSSDNFPLRIRYGASGRPLIVIQGRRADGNTFSYTGDAGTDIVNGTNYLMVVNVANDTISGGLWEEGKTDAPLATFSGAAVGGLLALGADSRIYLGCAFPNPGSSADDSHRAATLFAMAKAGTMTNSEVTTAWARSGGPRLTDFYPDGFDDLIFSYGHSAPNVLDTPLINTDDGCAAWFKGDGDTYTNFVNRKNPVDIVNPASQNLANAVRATVFAAGMAWSAFWQVSPGDPALNLDSVSGSLPHLSGIVTGTRITGTAAYFGAGVGNSRWANATPMDRAIDDDTQVCRNHAHGTRIADPDRDGGWYLPDLNQVSLYTNEFAVGVNTLVDSGQSTNWSRASYHGSQVALVGNGRPSFLETGTTTIYSLPTHVSEQTQHGVIVFRSPLGGTFSMRFADADADGSNATTSGDTLIGGGSSLNISADTAVGSTTVSSSPNSTQLTLASTAGIQVGHYVAPSGQGDINKVASISGNTVTFEHAWTTVPADGSSVSFGPGEYVLYEISAGSSTKARRGLALEHNSGGRVPIIAMGYRESDHGERVCMMPLGRGGSGYSAQAARQFSGTMQGIIESLTDPIIFHGLASQDLGDFSLVLPTRNDYETISTPDVVSASGDTLQNFAANHQLVRTGAQARSKAAYIQIADAHGSYLDQSFRFERLDGPHPNGRGMVEAGRLFWATLESNPSLLTDAPPSAPGSSLSNQDTLIPTSLADGSSRGLI